MGTSTVSGPFRSANGFQQLDENGVWVPVTGGGGGGGNVIADTVEIPTDGSENILQLPAPTELGQVFFVNATYPLTGLPNGSTALSIAPMNPANAVVLLGVYFDPGYNEVIQFQEVGSTGVPLEFSAPALLWEMRITYVGTSIPYLSELYYATYSYYGG